MTPRSCVALTSGADVTTQAGIAAGSWIGLTAVGVGVGAVGGALFDANNRVVSGAIGATMGLVIGGMTGLVTWGFLSPSEQDFTRLSSARGDIAEALNVAERRRLGLE